MHNRFFINLVKISGELKYFETLGSSGQIPLKSLCPTWFSTFGLPELVPEMISIRAGTLDDQVSIILKLGGFVNQTCK